MTETSARAQKSLQNNLFLTKEQAAYFTRTFLITQEQQRLVIEGIPLIKERLLYAIEILNEDNNRIEQLKKLTLLLADDSKYLANALTLNPYLANLLKHHFEEFPIITAFKDLFLKTLIVPLQNSLLVFISAITALKQHFDIDIHMAFDICKKIPATTLQDVPAFSLAIKNQIMFFLKNNAIDDSPMIHQQTDNIYNSLIQPMQNDFKNMRAIWQFTFINNYLRQVATAYRVSQNIYLFASKEENIDFISKLNAKQIKLLPPMIRELSTHMLLFMNSYENNYPEYRVPLYQNAIEKLFRLHALNIPAIYNQTNLNFNPFRAELVVMFMREFFQNNYISQKTLLFTHDLITPHFINTALQMSTLFYYNANRRGLNQLNSLLPIFIDSRYREHSTYYIDSATTEILPQNVVMFGCARHEMRLGTSLARINQSLQQGYQNNVAQNTQYNIMDLGGLIILLTFIVSAGYCVNPLLFIRNVIDIAWDSCEYYQQIWNNYASNKYNIALLKLIQDLPKIKEREKTLLLTDSECKNLRLHIKKKCNPQEKTTLKKLLTEYEEYATSNCSLSLYDFNEIKDFVILTLKQKKSERLWLKMFDYQTLLNHITEAKNKKIFFLEPTMRIRLHDNKDFTITMHRNHPEHIIAFINDARKKIKNLPRTYPTFFNSQITPAKNDDITDGQMAEFYVKNNCLKR